MMASIYNLMAVFILLCCVTATFAQENSTSEQGNNSSFAVYRINTRATELPNCKLIDSKFQLNKVLSKHDNSTTTNIVRITVSLANKTQYSDEIKLYWASEVGRTILTLVERAKQLRLFRSPLFTSPLEVGTEKVDHIQLSEKTEGCLQPEERKPEEIFDFVLRRLSHNDDTHFFKLCKAHKGGTIQYTTFNCCRIVGNDNLAICADYSSIVVKWAFGVIIFTCVIVTVMIVPFVLEYVITYPTETKFYKMSENPMSLLSIVSMVFFEGRGPIKSFFRRVVFLGISYTVAFLPDAFGYLWLQILLGVWALVFLFVNDIQMTYPESKKNCINNRKKKHECKEGGKCDRKCEEKCRKCNTKSGEKCKKCNGKCEEEYQECNRNCEKECKEPEWIKYLISCFTIPLHFPFYFYDKCLSFDCKDERLDSLKGFFSFILLLLSPIFCVCVFGFCLIKFLLVNLILFFSLPHHCHISHCVLKYSLPVLRLITLVIIAFVTSMAFILVLSLVVSFTLNAELYSPFVALAFAAVTYLWKNWRWSVTAKYLQLKTLIIEVSIKKVALEDTEQKNEDDTTAGENNEWTYKKCVLDFIHSGPPGWRKLLCCASDTKPEGFVTKCCAVIEDIDETENIIKFDPNGEAMISKDLYKTIGSDLHFDHLLFYFFRRVMFVIFYSICVLVILILIRDSGVSDTVQIISGIVSVLLPFVFDNIFAEHHFSQRISREAAMRQKLEHMLKVKKQENNTILVQLKGPSVTDRETLGPSDQQHEEDTEQTSEGPNDQSGTTQTPASSKKESGTEGTQMEVVTEPSQRNSNDEQDPSVTDRETLGPSDQQHEEDTEQTSEGPNDQSGTTQTPASSKKESGTEGTQMEVVTEPSQRNSNDEQDPSVTDRETLGPSDQQHEEDTEQTSEGPNDQSGTTQTPASSKKESGTEGTQMEVVTEPSQRNSNDEQDPSVTDRETLGPSDQQHEEDTEQTSEGPNDQSGTTQTPASSKKESGTEGTQMEVVTEPSQRNSNDEQGTATTNV